MHGHTHFHKQRPIKISFYAALGFRPML